MLTINWKIALVVVVLTPLSLFVAAFIGKMTHNRFTRQQALNGDISSYVEEHIGNQRIVKAFHMRTEPLKNLKSTTMNFLKWDSRRSLQAHLPTRQQDS